MTRFREERWLVVWRSRDFPEWLSDDQSVWDFRDDDGYEPLMEAAFPRRLARVIGIRAEGSRCAVGPIERVQVDEVGGQLEATGEFDYFLIEHL